MGSKLPEWLSSRCKRVLVGFRRVNGTYHKFREFVGFVQDEAEILNDPFMTSPSETHTNRPKHKTVRQTSTRLCLSRNYTPHYRM